MTEPDNFILRWARLKRASDIAQGLDSSRNGSEPKQAVSVRSERTAARPRNDAAPEEPFDTSGLPSIEAITADTDLRGFLRSGVPAELARAALRQAWTSDPAIRDFIGIAENQWDFNDPNAIPGFGPLQANGNEAAVLTQVLRRHEVFDTVLEPSASEAFLPSFAGGPTQAAVHEAAEHKAAELVPALADANAFSSSTENPHTSSKAEGVAAVKDHDRIQNRPHHGSAMPQ